MMRGAAGGGPFHFRRRRGESGVDFPLGRYI